ncbi:hypothetical protein QAD02_005723, partial [Eretmocerus hayati]
SQATNMLWVCFVIIMVIGEATADPATWKRSQQNSRRPTPTKNFGPRWSIRPGNGNRRKESASNGPFHETEIIEDPYTSSMDKRAGDEVTSASLAPRAGFHPGSLHKSNSRAAESSKTKGKTSEHDSEGAVQDERLRDQIPNEELDELSRSKVEDNRTPLMDRDSKRPLEEVHGLLDATNQLLVSANEMVFNIENIVGNNNPGTIDENIHEMSNENVEVERTGGVNLGDSSSDKSTSEDTPIKSLGNNGNSDANIDALSV